MARLSAKRIRQIILIVLLLAAIAITAALFINWQFARTTGLSLDFSGAGADQLPAPQFLYAFAGAGPGTALQKPTGVLVDGDKVLVTDAKRGTITVFRQDGTYVATWGAGKLRTPLYVAKNPLTGDYWVSDRGARTIHILSSTGVYKGVFDPKLPTAQLPKGDTKGVKWLPIALDFAPDGTLYVAEILNGHRLLIFKPDGGFLKSVGTAGMVNQLTQGAKFFQFPNSIKVHGPEVFIADSNNRRIQVFDRQGEFLKIIPTQGLPRGISFLYPGGPGGAAPTSDAALPASGTAGSTNATATPGRLVTVDVLAHDVTVWDVATGTKLVTFGERGVANGQFQYPNDVSVAPNNKIFIADGSNARVQVWGWPDALTPIPMPRTPLQWALCLSPLLLLPLLLLLRRKRFYATPDFIQSMLAAGLASIMPGGRRKWIVLQETYDMFSSVEVDGIRFADLLEVTEYSDSEARALQERLELTWPQAVDLATAKTAKVFCTENLDLRRLARMLEIDTVDREEYVRRFAKKTGPGGPGAPGGTPAGGPAVPPPMADDDGYFVPPADPPVAAPGPGVGPDTGSAPPGGPA
jgi:hypothetical protein